MENVFLLGTVYDYISEELYNEKLSRASEYEQMKQTYFKEIYRNNNTKITLWNLYHKNILYYEENLNKDLAYFTVQELDSLISSIPSSSIHIKASVYSFCTQYLDYCISKRLIGINNMNALDRETYTSISQKLASSKLISYEQLWDMVQYMETKTNIQNILPIIFAYYGIGGNDMEYMRNLRLEDLDRENEVAYIRLQGDLKAVLPIDEKLYAYCVKACEEADMDSEYVSSSLIIKPTKKSINDVVPENSIYARIYEAFDSSNIKRIRLNDLAKSRKITLLLEIRKERYLTTLDFQNICLLYNPNASRGIYNSLQKYYEMATGDKIFKANAKKDELIDLDIDKHLEKIYNNLGWEM